MINNRYPDLEYPSYDSFKMRFPLKFLPLSGVLSTLIFLSMMITIYVVHYGKPTRFITISDLARSAYIPETTVMAAGMTLESVFLFMNGLMFFITTKNRGYRKQRLCSALRYVNFLAIIIASFAMSCVGMFVVNGTGWKTPHNLSAGLFFIFTTLSNILVIILDWGNYVSKLISSVRIGLSAASIAFLVAYSTSFPSELAYDNLCEWFGIVLMFVVAYSTYFSYDKKYCRVEIGEFAEKLPRISEAELYFESE